MCFKCCEMKNYRISIDTSVDVREVQQMYVVLHENNDLIESDEHKHQLFITFVITHREVSFPSSLLCKIEGEAMSYQWLVRICGAHSLYPLKQGKDKVTITRKARETELMVHISTCCKLQTTHSQLSWR